jgi:hypothetical protein
MSETPSWYNQGYDGINKEEQRLQSLSGPQRLWLPPGTGRDLVLVDDEAFCIYEHNAKINGNWQNEHTCMKGVEDPCESCVRLGERSRYYIGYLTVVDCTLYVSKKGNKYQYELKLCGAKLGMLKKWRRKKDERGSLVMMKTKVHREDDNKPSTGDEWEYVKPVEDHDALFSVANYKGKKLSELWDKAEENEQSMDLLKQIFQLDFDDEGRLLRRVVPFNYMEILKPRGNDFIRQLLGGVTREEATGQSEDGDNGKKDVSAGSGGEDDVPF